MYVKLSFKRFWIAEAVTAAGAIGGAALNAISQARTNAQNRKQAEYAFQQEQMAIQRQNEYNSPANQVLRMKAAGLNPSLAYGADGAMVGNQADVPAYNAIPAEAPNVGNIGSALADSIRTGIEVKDLERRQALAKAEMALKDAETFAQIMKGQVDDATRTEILSMLGYKMDLAESQLDINETVIREANQRIENLKKEFDEIESRIGLNNQQINTLAAQYHLTETQAYAIIQKLPSEILQMDANTALMSMNTDVAREEIFKIRKDVEHIGWSEDFARRGFNVDLKKWDIEQKKWVEQLNQNRRMHLVDGLTNILGFTTGAIIMRSGARALGNQRSVLYTPNGTSFDSQTWNRSPLQ